MCFKIQILSKTDAQPFLEIVDNTKNLIAETSDISNESNIERINARTSNIEDSLIRLFQKFQFDCVNVSMAECTSSGKKTKTKTLCFVSS